MPISEPFPNDRLLSEDQIYSRAIACLLNPADPLTDLSPSDRNEVLRVVQHLKQAETFQVEAAFDELCAVVLETIQHLREQGATTQSAPKR